MVRPRLDGQMTVYLQRRKLMALLAGAAATWPMAARAQQAGAPPRIGYVFTGSDVDPVSQGFLAAFREGLQKLGWIDGRNLHIDSRSGANSPERVRATVTELLRLPPD